MIIIPKWSANLDLCMAVLIGERTRGRVAAKDLVPH